MLKVIKLKIEGFKTLNLNPELFSSQLSPARDAALIEMLKVIELKVIKLKIEGFKTLNLNPELFSSQLSPARDAALIKKLKVKG